MPRVVIVHDYVTQRGGAERVTLDLLRAFPGARLVTSCWDRASSFAEFADVEIDTLWLDRVAAFQRDPRLAFPLLASAFRSHVVADADVVICSSSGWAHRIDTPAPKIVYCHNPARWLYQPDDYFSEFSPAVRRGLAGAVRKLRRSDHTAAHTAKRYLANSTGVAARIHDVYGIEAAVVPPARGLSPLGPREAIPGIEPGFLVTVARARGYKNTEVVCDAVGSLPDERLVVVGDVVTPHRNVTSLGRLSDAQLRWLYGNAGGLVAVAHEDFGLTPVEAQAFGVPGVLLRAGGYLDTAVEGVTGVLVDEPSVVAVADGIRRLRAQSWDRGAIRRLGERYAPHTFAATMHEVVDDVLTGDDLRTPVRLSA